MSVGGPAHLRPRLPSTLVNVPPSRPPCLPELRARRGRHVAGQFPASQRAAWSLRVGAFEEGSWLQAAFRVRREVQRCLPVVLSENG